MAAEKLKHLNERFLSCVICKDIFTDPISLPCLHSFCRQCFMRYMQGNTEAVKRLKLQCPTCKQHHPLNNFRLRLMDVKEWIQPLKANHLIQGLLDDLVVDTSTTPSGPVADTRTSYKENVPYRERRIKCPQHQKNASYYCTRCEQAVCSECWNDHQRCGNVVHIKAMTSEIESLLEDRKQSLLWQLEQTDMIENTTNEDIADISYKHSNVRSEIKEASKKSIEEVKEWEKRLYDELDSALEERTEKLIARQKATQSDRQLIRYHLDAIDSVRAGGNEGDMFSMFQLARSGAISVLSVSEHDFSHDILEINVERSSGDLASHLGTLMVTTRKMDSDFKLNLIKSEAVKYADFWDVVVLDIQGVETVVATEGQNSCLRSFCTKNKQPHEYSLTLKGSPWAIARLRDNVVAVSVPKHNEIVTVKVTPKLLPLTTITTQKSYYGGLTALNGSTLVAGCYSPSSVDILDSEGRLKMSIKQGVWFRPRFLSTSHRGDILVSDVGLKSVLCLSPEGKIVFRYAPARGTLKNPHGITITPGGDILVADHDNNKIVQLKPDGRYVRDLLSPEDVTDPRAICFHKDKLYVTQASRPIREFRIHSVKRVNGDVEFS